MQRAAPRRGNVGNEGRFLMGHTLQIPNVTSICPSPAGSASLGRSLSPDPQAPSCRGRAVFLSHPVTPRRWGLRTRASKESSETGRGGRSKTERVPRKLIPKSP